MMGNGASLSFKGPLSLVCRAAGESMKVVFFFFSKNKNNNATFKKNTLLQNFSGFPHRTIYHEQCLLVLCFTWFGPGHRSAIS